MKLPTGGGPYSRITRLIGKMIGSNKRKQQLYRRQRIPEGIFVYQAKIETLENLKRYVIEMCNEDYQKARRS